MWNKLKKKLIKIGEAMEIFMAIVVGLAIIVAVISLIPEGMEFWRNRADSRSFLVFLENIFMIVIGIEFFKMLCKPDAENTIEALIFLIARHMIIGDTKTWEDLISVVSIVLLFAFKKLMSGGFEKLVARKRMDDKATHAKAADAKAGEAIAADKETGKAG